MNRRGFLKQSSASLTLAGGAAMAGCVGRGGERLTMAGYTGGDVSIRTGELVAFETSLDGAIIRRADAGYNDARTIWNACIDKRPALIAQPRSTTDVAKVVRFASQNGVSLSVRGGGHNHCGFAVSDNGLMLDLSQLNRGEFNRESSSAIAQSGMTWAQFDGLTHRAGLATTGAIVSMVGLPGYTLGGGIGWLHRKFGAGCDNLIGAEIVTATGDIVRAGLRDNEDLLWALRGGGGNFGVVTKLRYRLYPLSHVLAGLIFFPLDDVDAVGAFLDGYLADAPDDLNVWMLHRMAPPSPVVPRNHHGKPVLILAVTWTGDEATGERAIAPLSKIAAPIATAIKWRPYPEWQSALDGAWGDGFCNEWVGGYLNAYDGPVRDIIAKYVNIATSPLSDVKVARLGGEFSRCGDADSSFGHRDANYAYVIQTRWPRDEDSARHLAWTYNFHRALKQVDAGGVYVNFIGKNEPATRVEAAYTPSTLARLRAIKSEFDPDNLFSQNANIVP